MKLPKLPVANSISIETSKDGNKTTLFSLYDHICRNCGERVTLKRKSIDSFYYKCNNCNFGEEISLR